MLTAPTVVLSELPKQPGYSLPVARQITNGDEDDVEHMRSHAGKLPSSHCHLVLSLDHSPFPNSLLTG